VRISAVYIYPDHVVGLLLIVAVLAVAGITSIIVDGGITLPLRRKVIEKLGEEHPLAYLIHCFQCASIWVSIPFAIGVVALSPLAWWWALPLIPAFSYAATRMDR
jgi:hypothetical protein